MVVEATTVDTVGGAEVAAAAVVGGTVVAPAVVGGGAGNVMVHGPIASTRRCAGPAGSVTVTGERARLVDDHDRPATRHGPDHDRARPGVLDRGRSRIGAGVGDDVGGVTGHGRTRGERQARSTRRAVRASTRRPP